MTSDPSVAAIYNGKVQAGRRAGSARVVAAYGGASAEMTVTVTSPRPPAPAFRSGAKTLRIGAIQRLELLQGSSPVAVWSSSNPKVLAPLGQGFFWAKARGKSTVCMSQHSDKACEAVEVTK
jgi:hypothetical protein